MPKLAPEPEWTAVMTIAEQREEARHERRCHSRLDVGWAGRILHGDGEEPCTVLDFSPGGAKIESERTFSKDTLIRLRMTEEGEFAGTVAWISARLMGLRFRHLPID